jgi:hypothetical protein
VQVDDEGKWSFTPEQPLNEGEHVLTVIERDPAGNESAPGDPYVVIVDTTAPDTPVISAVIDGQGSVTGPIASGGTTDDARPEIRGTAEPGTTVTIFDNGQALGTVQTGDDGNWSFTLEESLGDGQHNLTAMATDAAGNSSEPSGQFGFSLQAPGNYVVDIGSGEWSNYLSWSPIMSTNPHRIREVNDVLEVYVQGASPDWDRELSFLRLSAPKGEKMTSVSMDIKTADADRGFTVKFGYADSNGYIVGYSDAQVLANGSNHLEFTAPVGYYVTLIYFDYLVPTNSFYISNISFQTDAYQPATTMSSDVGVQELNSSIAALDSEDESIAGTPTENPDTASELQGIADVSDAEGHVPADSDVDVPHLNDVTSVPDSDDQAIASALNGNPDTVFGLQGIEYSAGVLDDINSVRGLDVLKLTGSGLVLDLANLGENFSSIEVVDLTGAGNNTLKLSLNDVLNQGDVDLFHESGKSQMMVKGDAGDVVDLAGLMGDADPGEWSVQGQVSLDGVIYEVYQHSSQEAELLVQQGVTTHLL